MDYSVPISIDVLNAKTSLLIPPLLGLTYALLGSVLPVASEALTGRGRATQPIELPRASTAALAVASTISIIKLSEVLFTAPWLPAGCSVAILLAACGLQWRWFDGAWSSLALALLVAVGGPLAELPFLYAGAWHYTAPDYFPLTMFGALLGGGTDAYAWAGINWITAPCYFAVTTDAIALGRWLTPVADARQSQKS